jgi:hypothetical protein
MRLAPLALCLLLSAMLLSGCFGGDGDGEETPTTTTSSTTTTTSSGTTTTTSSSTTTTTPPPPPANNPPTGSISAVVNGTTATFTLTGTDQDGDALTWALAFGDGATSNGTVLPATVNHTYAAAGNFSVVYSLTDGEDSTSYNVTVTAVAGGGAVAPAVFAGTATGSCQLFDPVTFETICLPMDAIIEHGFPVPAGVTAVNLLLEWSFDAPVVTDLDLYVLDSAGE